ncbi:MAG: pheromone processing endoprotease [Bathelium mastoideum]|nr:MAG: pheromone processing endoprotease [Bathelium mastoideum]
MHLHKLWIAATALACTVAADYPTVQTYDTHDYYALHVDPATSPHHLAAHLGLELDGPIGHLKDHYLFKSTKHDHDIVENAKEELRRRRRKRHFNWEPHILDSVLLNQKQELRQRLFKRVPPSPRPLDERSRADLALAAPGTPTREDNMVLRGKEIANSLDIRDPIWNEQWHLYNPVQSGNDLNVTDVWKEGITGKNTTVCFVDDGIDMDNPDLKNNYFAKGSYDFNDKGPEPRPRLSDDNHGTRCAGEVSAVKNDVCGVGVAWDSKVAALRILSAAISDADEAAAMTYGFQDNMIYSCSWGPPDDGRSMDAPGILIRRAMVTAIQQGRGGLGTIYVFAAGNGAASDDNCNFDGYTNSIYSITVGAIDRTGSHPYYSESCSAQLVVTYSSGSGDNIHTTDRITNGESKCSSSHGGTSAAGPLAVGVYALALQVRPDLTWRDMQWLSVLTAVPLDNPSDWQDTALGKKFSHMYGYGKLDAWQFVDMAKNYTNVKPQAWYFGPWMHVKKNIPQGEQGLASQFEITKQMLQESNLERVEHVTVTMNVEHTRRGDLSVELRSPTGVVSHLSTARRNDAAAAGYVDWTFMSVAHWGESGIGTWTVVLKDTVENEHQGTFVDWRIKLWGECIDPAIQGILPLPEETDDADHDRIDAPAHTITISRPTDTATAPPGNPSDHVDRPVNSKTSSSTLIASSASTSPTALPSQPEDEVSQPIATTTADLSSSPSAVSPTASPSSTDLPDTFLPSPFPTFGVRKRTQIWIYAALALILAFVLALGCYLFWARRRARRNVRDAYEFDTLPGEEDFHDDDDDEGARGNGAGAGAAAGRARRKKRARELYDAFAEGSEEEVFSLGEDEEDEDEGGEGYGGGGREKHG